MACINTLNYICRENNMSMTDLLGKLRKDGYLNGRDITEKGNEFMFKICDVPYVKTKKKALFVRLFS